MLGQSTAVDSGSDSDFSGGVVFKDTKYKKYLGNDDGIVEVEKHGDAIMSSLADMLAATKGGEKNSSKEGNLNKKLGFGASSFLNQEDVSLISLVY